MLNDHFGTQAIRRRLRQFFGWLGGLAFALAAIALLVAPARRPRRLAAAAARENENGRVDAAPRRPSHSAVPREQPRPTLDERPAPAATDQAGVRMYEETDTRRAAADVTTLVAAERYAQERWGTLRMRVRSITPSGLARFLLTTGALAMIGSLIWSYRAALAPFLAGMVLAYISSPLVSMFDRILPRWMAVLSVVIGELLALLGILVILVPPLAQQGLLLLGSLPSADQLRQIVGEIIAYLNTLPEPIRNMIRDGLRQALEAVRGNLSLYLQGLLSLGVSGALGLLNTFGFILSFLVVPTWLFAVLGDRRFNAGALGQQMPGWLRADFGAVARILDRTFKAFLRGQVIVALMIGLLTYAGARLMTGQGWLEIRYPLILALFAGLLALIPAVGPTLYAVTVVLLGLLHSQSAAALLLLLAIVVQLLVNQFVVPLVERGYSGNVHPALMIIAIVMVSQFGLFWLLLAAPITAAVVELYRYVYGRFRDPPRPAGLLPGEPLPQATAAAPPPVRRRGVRPTRLPFRGGPTVRDQA